MITIVNIRQSTNKTYIYCGRGSALGNPFVMSNEAMRDEVCDRYEKYFYEQINLKKNKDIIKQLENIKLKAKRGDVDLGCFCTPKRCHCETIKRYVEQQI